MLDPHEQRALANIEQYGCHILHVAAEEDLPPFSYSIGIQRSSGRPEVAVIGLKQPLAQSVINDYNHRVREGEMFTTGRRCAGFLEGFDVLFEKVDEEFYREYFGWDLWLYAGPAFDVLQIVYPTTAGIWPWEPAASDWFRKRQPLLTRKPVGATAYD